MSEQVRKTSRVIGINSIVYNVLNDIDANTQNNFLRYKQWAIRGLKAIRMHVVASVEISVFTVDVNNIVNLPDDYIKHRRIGVVRNGRIWTLTQDDAIPITTEEANGGISQYADIEDAEMIPDLATWYAAPAKAFNLAFHRYDKENNRLIFSGDMIGETVVVEYVSTGVTERGDILVPVEAEEALIAWVHKQRVLHDKNASVADKQLMNQEFRAAMNDLIDYSVYSFTLDDLLDAINANNTQLTKR